MNQTDPLKFEWIDPRDCNPPVIPYVYANVDTGRILWIIDWMGEGLFCLHRPGTDPRFEPLWFTSSLAAKAYVERQEKLAFDFDRWY